MPRPAQQPELSQDHATGTVLLECHHSVAAGGHTTYRADTPAVNYTPPSLGKRHSLKIHELWQVHLIGPGSDLGNRCESPANLGIPPAEGLCGC